MGFEPACPILDHITVLDLTRVRSGPTCVRQLADWGANVIKIETPSNAGADMGGTRDSSDFQNLQRNKRSLVLDLKSEAGRSIFLKMATQADVIVENYRPDVKHRLGIDYQTVRELNPGIVYASISGFGQDGPLSKRPGFDQIAQGMGGLMSITGAPGEGPMRVGIPIADLTAGGFAAQGVLLALIGRQKTGTGQWVQTSLLQAQIAMLDFQATRWLMDDEVPGQAGNNHPTNMPQGVYRTSDGHMNIAAAGSHIFARLKQTLNDPRLDDPRFEDVAGRSTHRDDLNTLIEDTTSTQTTAYWIEKLNEVGVPSGEINTIDRVFQTEQVEHLGIAREMQSHERGKTQVVGQPIIMSDADPSIQRPPPGKGEHSQEILAEYGYTEDDIHSFSEKGII